MKTDSIILATLTVATSLLAGILCWQGVASWLEAVSFVTGAVCVWLTVKENVWNFPIGLLNVATFVFVFAKAHLFGDAGLQVVYFVLTLIGWYLWLYGGERHTGLRVVRASTLENALVVGICGALTVLLWQLLPKVGGSASFWDALTTAISLGAQWLLNRKRLENWIAWIVVDVIYVPLYLYKGLYLTAILYAVFLAMAVMGLRAWHAKWVELQSQRGFDVVGAEDIPFAQEATRGVEAP
ncbi:MAG: nicotinamide riboside transporter PnuC [Tepidisphaeraceae bacterium]